LRGERVLLKLISSISLELDNSTTATAKSASTESAFFS